MMRTFGWLRSADSSQRCSSSWRTESTKYGAEGPDADQATTRSGSLRARLYSSTPMNPTSRMRASTASRRARLRPRSAAGE